MNPSTIESLAGAQFVLLTTFRRDGRAVGTPVWVAPLDGPDGPGLGVWTPGSSGKVKRVRRDGAVTLAPCDRRGTPLGEPVPGTARVLDAEGTRRVRTAVRRKYGLLGLAATAVTGRRAVGLAITLT
ncbi:MAG: PPOX class F420-dependent oxidoreductase [Pseudonocardiales bacterium]|nr:PPOX class F420-dependent oxidoreductase [Pseudonocardiales bacterium]